MTDHPTTDAELVAFLHGELDAKERRTVKAQLARDPDARARLAVLEATDSALGEALDRELAPRQVSTMHSIGRPLLALAAVLCVVAIFVFRQTGEKNTATQNEHIEVRMAPLGGAAAPLFTDAGFELFWHNRDGGDRKREVQVLPFPFGTTPEQAREQTDVLDIISDNGPVHRLPLIVTAQIRDPEGNVIEARFAPRDGKRWRMDGLRATQTVRLRDFEIMTGGMRPTLIGNPGDREWQNDAEWGIKNMAKDRTARWFPELPGEYRIELSINTAPAPAKNPWPTFAEPLVVSTSILMTGEVSDWGAPHDGMRARLVWSTGARSASNTPFAVQISNEGTESKKYNYGGRTIAVIPQPLHFTLLVDGEEWTQSDHAPMILGPGDLFQLHPVAAVRSIVTRAGMWHRDGKSLDAFPGPHTVEVLFHFEPSVWNAADTSFWHGKLPTGKLSIDVPKAR